MMVVKIYGEGRAVCPQRVMHCLVEKGVPFEIVHVDIDTMEHKQPEFLEKQVSSRSYPASTCCIALTSNLNLSFASHSDKFPTLLTATSSSSSRAIARYYAAKYEDRGPSLLGRTPEERAKVEQWLDVEAINYNPFAFPVVFNLFILPILGMPGNKAEALDALEKLDEVLEVYEKQLSKTKYLAGDEFTLADLAHIPATRYIVEKCGLAHLFDDKKHVKAWWEDISGRPGWKKVMSLVESGASYYSP